MFLAFGMAGHILFVQLRSLCLKEHFFSKPKHWLTSGFDISWPKIKNKKNLLDTATFIYQFNSRGNCIEKEAKMAVSPLTPQSSGNDEMQLNLLCLG